MSTDECAWLAIDATNNSTYQRVRCWVCMPLTIDANSSLSLTLTGDVVADTASDARRPLARCHHPSCTKASVIIRNDGSDDERDDEREDDVQADEWYCLDHQPALMSSVDAENVTYNEAELKALEERIATKRALRLSRQNELEIRTEAPSLDGPNITTGKVDPDDNGKKRKRITPVQPDNSDADNGKKKAKRITPVLQSHDDPPMPATNLERPQFNSYQVFMQKILSGSEDKRWSEEWPDEVEAAAYAVDAANDDLGQLQELKRKRKFLGADLIKILDLAISAKEAYKNAMENEDDDENLDNDELLDALHEMAASRDRELVNALSEKYGEDVPMVVETVGVLEKRTLGARIRHARSRRVMSPEMLIAGMNKKHGGTIITPNELKSYEDDKEIPSLRQLAAMRLVLQPSMGTQIQAAMADSKLQIQDLVNRIIAKGGSTSTEQITTYLRDAEVPSDEQLDVMRQILQAQLTVYDDVLYEDEEGDEEERNQDEDSSQALRDFVDTLRGQLAMFSDRGDELSVVSAIELPTIYEVAAANKDQFPELENIDAVLEAGTQLLIPHDYENAEAKSAAKAATEEAKSAAKAAKEEAKSAAKAAKEEAKSAEKAAKEEAKRAEKAAKEEAKSAAKAAKEEAKRAEKVANQETKRAEKAAKQANKKPAFKKSNKTPYSDDELRRRWASRWDA